MTRRTRSRERPKREQEDNAQALQHVNPPPRFSEAIGLKLLVFSAGGVLMGLEIAGSRVLAPHFGNSVFVWGSLISIFLVALSAGYYFGGQVADRYPSHALLNSICIVVALLIFAIAVFARALCGNLVEAGFGEQSGPLVASMLLFLPPSVGMGMVSPFAIRLAAQSVSSVGKISGTLYALSTGGSIAGTLLTTFVLIPLFGVSAILKGLALFLLLISVVTFPYWKRMQPIAGAIALGLLALAAWFAPELATAAELGKTIIDVDTPYHHISVIDGQFYGQDARMLRFNRYTESEISPSPPYPSLAGYTNYFHLAFLATPKIERTLFIGAGGAIGPREFHMQDPAMAIDVVDIDPKVLELTRTHFHLYDYDEPAVKSSAADKIKTIAKDGRMFLRKAQNEYDCIILDAFTAGGRIPFHLVTREFFELCRERMTDDGVFVMNINSSVNGPMSRIYHSMYRTISSVFPNTYVFEMKYPEPGVKWDGTQSTNIILLATKNEHRIPPAEWFSRAAAHHSRSYIEEGQVQAMIGDLLVEVPDTSAAPLFTDDYAPIETMPF